jgi:hypothetical protein
VGEGVFLGRARDVALQTVPTSSPGEQRAKIVRNIDRRFAKITNVLSNLF